MLPKCLISLWIALKSLTSKTKGNIFQLFWNKKTHHQKFSYSYKTTEIKETVF